MSDLLERGAEDALRGEQFARYWRAYRAAAHSLPPIRWLQITRERSELAEIAGEGNLPHVGTRGQRYRETLQMCNGQIAPLVAQILSDQSAVATFGRRLTAQQHSRDGEQTTVDALFDASLAHQGKKATLIRLPAPFLLLILVKQILSRGEQWFMLVVCVTDHAQKIGKVVALGETSQLRRIVQANI